MEKKFEEMTRQTEEMTKKMEMVVVELEVFATKVTETTEERRKLEEKLVQLKEKCGTLESTSTFDELKKEWETLKAEDSANNEKRAELEAAWDGKRKELEELEKARECLFNSFVD
jgi:predicted  nucleic acid-binding Zn-ribbon protein